MPKASCHGPAMCMPCACLLQCDSRWCRLAIILLYCCSPLPPALRVPASMSVQAVQVSHNFAELHHHHAPFKSLPGKPQSRIVSACQSLSARVVLCQGPACWRSCRRLEGLLTRMLSATPCMVTLVAGAVEVLLLPEPVMTATELGTSEGLSRVPCASREPPGCTLEAAAAIVVAVVVGVVTK